MTRPKCGLSPSGICQDRTCEECAIVGPFNSLTEEVDVTEDVKIGQHDDDLLSFEKCVCGRTWGCGIRSCQQIKKS